MVHCQCKNRCPSCLLGEFTAHAHVHKLLHRHIHEAACQHMAAVEKYLYPMIKYKASEIEKPLGNHTLPTLLCAHSLDYKGLCL